MPLRARPNVDDATTNKKISEKASVTLTPHVSPETNPLLNSMRSLHYRRPKPGQDVYVANAVFRERGDDTTSASHRLRLKISGVEVMRVGDGLSNTLSIVLGVSKGQASELMLCDAEAIDRSQEGLVGGWFDGGLDSHLLHEYYRPVIVADAKKDLVAKMIVMVDSEGPQKPRALLEEASNFARSDVTLQFVGLQFRKQQFSLAWKLVEVKESVTEAEAEAEVEVEAEPRAEAAKQKTTNKNTNTKTNTKTKTKTKPFAHYAFHDESVRETSEADDDDDDLTNSGPYPSYEEYEAMKRDALRALEIKRTSLSRDLEFVSDLHLALTNSDEQDLALLERATADL
jgi:hypothetical protein